jgi:hypothetical protein
MILVGDVEISEEVDPLTKKVRVQFWGPEKDVDKLVYDYSRHYKGVRYQTKTVQRQAIQDGWIIVGVERLSSRYVPVGVTLFRHIKPSKQTT